MIKINALLLILNICVMISKTHEVKLGTYMFACRSTDFVCFKRQFRELRDHVLLGNMKLAITFYKPYIFKYGDTNTCIKISGIEDSKLVAVGMNINSRAYAMTLSMPLHIQQINDSSVPCATPDTEFTKIKMIDDDEKDDENALMNFSGKATVTVSYPYVLNTKMNKTYMFLEDESMDVTLDIPNYRDHDNTSNVESEMFERSEWAYSVVQHIDVAQHCMQPFTKQFRHIVNRFPLEKFLLLYPDETFSTLQFAFNYDIEHPIE